MSSLASDNPAGTGAWTVTIIGLETPISEEYTFETITLDGTTPVTSTKIWWRVNRMYVTTGGSNGLNNGTITCRSSSDNGIIFSTISPTFNQAAYAVYTVPFNKRMLLKRFLSSIVRSNGSLGSASVSILARQNVSDAVYRTIRTFNLQTGSILDTTMLGGITFNGGTDIIIRIGNVSDSNTSCQAELEYLLLRQ